MPVPGQQQKDQRERGGQAGPAGDAQESETAPQDTLPAGDGQAPDDAERADTAEQDDAVEFDQRRAKMERLRAEGIDPYPHVSLVRERTLVAELLAAHDPSQLSHGEHPELGYHLAGRLISRRGHGKTSFLDLRDLSGQVQIVVRHDTLGEEAYERIMQLDVGDIVGVKGCVYVTQRGQLALAAHECTLLTKTLRPPPDKRHGLGDTGTRYRYRELDLIANEQTRELFVARAKIVAAIRDWLNERNFVEVETPALQSLAGGAGSRPFTTYHNALDRELYLRISVELYLNRCIVGGLENVYDMGKAFRNEGISYKHSPEFTILEFMLGYSDYNDVATATEEMFADVARRVLGRTEIKRGGETIDLAKPWRRITMREAILQKTGVDFMASDRAAVTEQLKELLQERIHPATTWAQLTHAVYTKLIEPNIVQPTHVFDFPLEPFPITKPHAEHPELAEHFDAVIGGVELVSGDTELNDPVDQWRRFVEQRQRRALDDGDVPHPNDEEYARAIEYGYAPTAGGGMGVDRLVMILTERDSLREVIPFPIVRDIR
ncbi:MAG TPA: lysine--tRNA ligase [Solirubrobacteraceae bacterium]|nr:lysine--tRNA ligase [Solirubrobacteraceae bacterium]